MAAHSAVATRSAEIVVGQPLPFSVFGRAKKLLLAKGRMVESDSMRDSLIAHGLYYEASASTGETREPEEEIAPHPAPIDPLVALRSEYTRMTDRSRLVLQMSRGDSAESHTSWMIGAHDNAFVLTAPVTRSNACVPIGSDETWVFRAFLATTAVRFQAQVRKVLSAPFPHLHIGTPEKVERRRVRGSARAPVCLEATLGAGGGLACVIVDLSTGGARIAVRSSVELAKGDRVRLQSTIPVLGRTYVLSNECTVVAHYGAVDSRFPEAHFYGVRFSKAGETDELVLHGYVHQQLSSSLNTLGTLLCEADAA